jgi:hypothetical protein
LKNVTTFFNIETFCNARGWWEKIKNRQFDGLWWAASSHHYTPSGRYIGTPFPHASMGDCEFRSTQKYSTTIQEGYRQEITEKT